MSSKSARLLLLTLTLGLMSPTVMAFFWSSSPKDLLKPTDAKIITKGQQVYDMSCAACHGSKLQGQFNWRSRDAQGYLPAPPHDPSGHTWHHPSEQLFNMVKYGIQHYAGADYKSHMPKFERALSDEQIVAVLSYIKSTWPKDIQAKHDQINQQARSQNK
ncbi:MAG: c-type cytochrome [Burkholderiaceae bacterium]|jgi:mono/diheme cytochrome c family protein